jgi:hypothetical protein
LGIAVYFVLRNLVPVAGVLFLGWSARQQLVLYFLDTLLSLTVLFALALANFFPIDNEDGLSARINSAGGVFGSAVAITAVLAVPLGMPLVFMLAPHGVPWEEFTTRSFGVSVGLHMTLALLTFAAFYRDMRAMAYPLPALKRQVPFAIVRWIAVIMVLYTGIPLLLGEYGGLLLVVIYAACGIAVDIAPGRVRRAIGA